MDKINIDLPPGFSSAISAMEKQFVSMRSSGASIKDIAKTLKKSTQTVCDWNKKFANEILKLRYSEFCDLQKKVIDLKSSRLDFIKLEIERVKKVLQKQKISKDESLNEYNEFLELYFKLSNQMSNFESEMLMVGVRYKDNISPETGAKEDENSSNSVSQISEESQKTEGEKDVKITDNNKFSAYAKLSKMNQQRNNRNDRNVSEK